MPTFLAFTHNAITVADPPKHGNLERRSDHGSYEHSILSSSRLAAGAVSGWREFPQSQETGPYQRTPYSLRKRELSQYRGVLGQRDGNVHDLREHLYPALRV